MRKTGFILGMAMALALMGASMVSEASEQTDNEEAVSVVSEGGDIIASGVDGSLTWVIDADGKLTITGKGNYTSKAWLDYADQILTAEVEVTGITSTKEMFLGCKNLRSIDVGSLDTGNVSDMSYMFSNCYSLESVNVSGFNTSRVRSMRDMFFDCRNLSSLDLSGFDTSNVSDMYNMFSNCQKLSNLDISNFNTCNVKNMGYMFRACSSLSSLDLSHFDTGVLLDAWCMFIGCESLRSLNLSSFNLRYASGGDDNASNSVGYDAFLSGCDNLDTIYTPYNLAEMVTLPSASGSVWHLPDETKITELPVNLNYSVKLTRQNAGDPADDSIIARSVDGNLIWMIDTDGKLTITGTGDCRIKGWLNHSDQILSAEVNVTGMMQASLFSYCTNLISVDLSGFDASNVTNMKYMFTGCNTLITIKAFKVAPTQTTCELPATFVDEDGFKTTRITALFAGKTLTKEGAMSTEPNVIASGGNENFTWVIDANGKLTIKGRGVYSYSPWKDYADQILTAEVNGSILDARSMFSRCSNLKSVDLSNFDTSNVTDMYGMFYGCSNLESINFSGLDTSNVTHMSAMFSGCSNLSSVDLNSFDTSNVKDMYDMFYGCSSLSTIKAFKIAPTQTTCELPATYVDEAGNKTTQITSAFAGKTLTREGVVPAEPEPPSDNPSNNPTDDPSVNPSDNPAEQQVRNFVSRMYTVALGRDAEEAGLNDWTNRLLTHEIDGAGIANGFIMSEEFDNKKVSDDTYVDILYRTFFDREADEGGRTDWLTKLANGNSRAFVLAGFVNSAEFDNLCNRYSIIRGEMQTNETAIGVGVRQFVERCYNKVLGRDSEEAGLNDWTGRIARGEESPESVAKLFFFSEEYANKNTDNETFVETLYQTFMGRDSDPAGKTDWVGRLSSGTSREEVLEGFSRSEEFAEILKSFGL